MAVETAYLLSFVPPWLVITVLLGIAHSSLFFLLAGRRPMSMPVYWALGTTGGLIGQLVGLQLGTPSPLLAIGEVHVPALSAGAWLLLSIARLLGV